MIALLRPHDLWSKERAQGKEDLVVAFEPPVTDGARSAESPDAAVADVGGQRRVKHLGGLEAERLNPVEDALARAE